MGSQHHSKARILTALKHIQQIDLLRRDYSPVKTFAATAFSYYPWPSPGLLLIY